MMEDVYRCKKVFERLDSRCVLKIGHKGKHLFPNAFWKKDDPKSWEVCRKSFFTWSKDNFRKEDVDHKSTDHN